MTYRDRGLLDLAHKLDTCTNCGAYSAEGLEPAHENGIVAGKGQSIKSWDNRHAALCHRCHAFYDSGGNGMDPSKMYTPSREDKRELWNRAHKRTYDQYWYRGWLRVA